MPNMTTSMRDVSAQEPAAKKSRKEVRSLMFAALNGVTAAVPPAVELQTPVKMRAAPMEEPQHQRRGWGAEPSAKAPQGHGGGDVEEEAPPES
eukprot:6004188-Amphidinium_carterae.1